MTARVRSLQRLLHLRNRAVDDAVREQLLRAAETRAATAGRNAAERALGEALDDAIGRRDSMTVAADLETRDLGLQFLRHAVEVASARERDARVREESAAGRVAEARRKALEIERLLETIATRAKEHEDRREQQATDDLAARIASAARAGGHGA
jgi:flagellar biosynthesis chaperone FliJ